MFLSLRALSCLQVQRSYVLCQHDDIGNGRFEFPKSSCDHHPTHRLQTSDLRRDAKTREHDSCSITAGMMVKISYICNYHTCRKSSDNQGGTLSTASTNSRLNYPYIHTYTHTYIHTSAYIHAYTYINTYIYIYIYIHKYIPTYIHIYIYTHTHTHTHTSLPSSLYLTAYIILFWLMFLTFTNLKLYVSGILYTSHCLSDFIL